MQLKFKTPENNRNNVFRGQQLRNKVPCIIFRGLEDRKMVSLMFWIQNHSIKDISNVFSDYKQTSRCTCCIQRETCDKIGAPNAVKT